MKLFAFSYKVLCQCWWYSSSQSIESRKWCHKKVIWYKVMAPPTTFGQTLKRFLPRLEDSKL